VNFIAATKRPNKILRTSYYSCRKLFAENNVFASVMKQGKV